MKISNLEGNYASGDVCLSQPKTLQKNAAAGLSKIVFLFLLTLLFGLSDSKQAYAMPPNDPAVEFTITSNADDYIGVCKGFLNGYVKLRFNFTAPYNYCTNLYGTLYLEKNISGTWTTLNTTSFSNVASQVNFSYAIANVPNVDYFRVRVEFTAAKYGGVDLTPPPVWSFPNWLGETDPIAYYDLIVPGTTAPNAAYTINAIAASPSVASDIAPCNYTMLLTNLYSATQFQLALTKNGTTITTAWTNLSGSTTIPLGTILSANYVDITGSYSIKLTVRDDCERYSNVTGLWTVYANPATPTLLFNVLTKTAATTSVSSRYVIYSCAAALTMEDKSTGKTAGFPYKYRVTLTRTDDAAGTVNATVIGTTPWGAFPLDLRNIPFTNSNDAWLNNVANTGYYSIKVELQNFCTGAVLSTANAYITFSGPPTAPSTTLTIGGNYIDGDGNQTEASSSTTTTSSPLILCAGPDYYYFKCGSTSGVVTGYKKSTWKIVSGVYTNVVAEATTATASLPSAGSSLFGSSGFAPLENVLYAFRLEVFNACSSIVKEQYFQVVYTCKQAGGTKVVDAAKDEDNNNAGITTTTRMFPNPVKDLLTIQSPLVDQQAQIILFDMQGKQVQLPVNIGNGEATVNTSSLANGVYTVELINKGEVTRARFVK